MSSERQKRRDLEDIVDDLKAELGWQRESIAKSTHAISKLASAGLQQAERSDSIAIFVIKKKGQQARGFFEAYKGLQKLILDDKGW